MNSIAIAAAIVFGSSVILAMILVVEAYKIKVMLEKQERLLHDVIKHKAETIRNLEISKRRYQDIAILYGKVLSDLAYSTNKQSIEWKLFILTQIDEKMCALASCEYAGEETLVAETLHKILSTKDVDMVEMYINAIKDLAKGYFVMEPLKHKAIENLIDHLVVTERTLANTGVRNDQTQKYINMIIDDLSKVNFTATVAVEPVPDEPEEPDHGKSAEELMEVLLNAARDAGDPDQNHTDGQCDEGAGPRCAGESPDAPGSDDHDEGVPVPGVQPEEGDAEADSEEPVSSEEAESSSEGSTPDPGPVSRTPAAQVCAQVKVKSGRTSTMFVV